MPMKRVLFVCIENSNRSQMAEAFARMQGGDAVEALSAGSRPSGVINPKASVQIGIRTQCDDYLGVEYIDARTVHERGVAHAVARAKAIVGDRPCYVTFDIDCLDPSAAPGTGTPVWGGLHSWQAAAALRDLAGINMVGGDVVEVSPPFDTTGATAIAGAHVAHELICLYHWARTGR